MELVENAVFNSSADHYIVSAIICLGDDKFIHRKTSVTSSSYKFTSAQRVRLLKSELDNWFWVYDQSDDDR